MEEGAPGPGRRLADPALAAHEDPLQRLLVEDVLQRRGKVGVDGGGGGHCCGGFFCADLVRFYGTLRGPSA
jgi:hypothetical protein